jgi:hypothetical protein
MKKRSPTSPCLITRVPAFMLTDCRLSARRVSTAGARPFSSGTFRSASNRHTRRSCDRLPNCRVN